MAVTGTKKTSPSSFPQPQTRRQLKMIAARDEESKKRKASEVLEVDLSAPEPPSKKALRRAKRSGTSVPVVSKAAENTPLETASSSQALEAEKPAKRSGHGIWIGNLVYTVTKADVRRFLKEKGAIEDDEITRIHLPLGSSAGPQSKASKGASKVTQNKGFAYVDFTTSSALDRAVALTEHLLSGRKVLIKDAKSFEGRPQSSPKDASKPPAAAKAVAKNKRVFIGNLSFDTTEENLLERLRQCGEVTGVHVATFEDTGKCKGYAWAEFVTLEAAEAAVRGWIPSTEPDNTSEDEESTEDGAGSDDADDKPRKVARKRAKKPKKHWINRIKGRTLRMEFAEDKATRYKKRYGQGGIKRTAGVANVHARDGSGTATTGTEAEAEKPPDWSTIKASQQWTTGKKIKFE